eukprot:COSAG05_NODE_22649_length_263_cov_0.676829_1_plen_20_part_10
MLRGTESRVWEAERTDAVPA